MSEPSAAALNRYRQAQFLLSVNHLRQLPTDSGREVAFAGRSNAGKSSALNAITDQGSLARTSKTPGRTQMINYFAMNEQQRLVDLPGYGFAKVPEAVKRDWHKLLEGYFEVRQSLAGLIILMDIRHPLKEFDLMMLNWCQSRQLPAHILLTKADKLKRGAAKSTLLQVANFLRQQQLPATLQLFSAPQKSGVEAVRLVLDGWLALPEVISPAEEGDPLVGNPKPTTGESML